MGYQIVQKKSPAGSIFGSLVDGATKIVPELMKYKNQLETDNKFVEKNAANIDQLADAIANNEQFAKFYNENPSVTFGKTAQEFSDYIKGLKGKGDRREYMDDVVEAFKYAYDVGKDKMPENWLVETAARGYLGDTDINGYFNNKNKAKAEDAKRLATEQLAASKDAKVNAALDYAHDNNLSVGNAKEYFTKIFGGNNPAIIEKLSSAYSGSDKKRNLNKTQLAYLKDLQGKLSPENIIDDNVAQLNMADIQSNMEELQIPKATIDKYLSKLEESNKLLTKHREETARKQKTNEDFKTYVNELKQSYDGSTEPEEALSTLGFDRTDKVVDTHLKDYAEGIRNKYLDDQLKKGLADKEVTKSLMKDMDNSEKVRDRVMNIARTNKQKAETRLEAAMGREKDKQNPEAIRGLNADIKYYTDILEKAHNTNLEDYKNTTAEPALQKLADTVNKETFTRLNSVLRGAKKIGDIKKRLKGNDEFFYDKNGRFSGDDEITFKVNGRNKSINVNDILNGGLNQLLSGGGSDE